MGAERLIGRKHPPSGQNRQAFVALLRLDAGGDNHLAPFLDFGGNAVADVLFGDANPGGRLPLTFYKAEEKLPAFDDYTMQGRTYRYFGGEPLYPFGYGLSYTRFAYSGLKLDRDKVGAKEPVRVTLKVKNAGQRAGDEVVQLYLRPLEPQRARALKELRGFQRLTLQPGEERSVSFAITPETDLRIYDEARHAYTVDPGEYEVQIGASSADVRLARRIVVRADGAAQKAAELRSGGGRPTAPHRYGQ